MNIMFFKVVKNYKKLQEDSKKGKTKIFQRFHIKQIKAKTITLVFITIQKIKSKN